MDILKRVERLRPKSGGRKIPDAVKPRITQRILAHAKRSIRWKV